MPTCKIITKDFCSTCTQAWHSCVLARMKWLNGDVALSDLVQKLNELRIADGERVDSVGSILLEWVSTHIYNRNASGFFTHTVWPEILAGNIWQMSSWFTTKYSANGDFADLVLYAVAAVLDPAYAEIAVPRSAKLKSTNLQKNWENDEFTKDYSCQYFQPYGKQI